MATEKSYWLVKSEPDCFSIEHLANSPRQTTCWSGVRNYQARNYMRDGMKLGDSVLYYHSSVDPPAVVGTAKVVRESYADHTALDERDDHFDPKATKEEPIWMMVDIQLDEVFARDLPIDELRKLPALKNMELLKRGSRLSVQPVSKAEFAAIMQLAHAVPPTDKQGTSPQPSTANHSPAKTAAKKPDTPAGKRAVKKKASRAR
jgi:predicted RNA-binding protein with PUA-like domain